MLLQETIYKDANFVLLHGETPTQITEDYFNLLVNGFKTNYLQSKKYEERINKHRNPIVVMNEILNDLYAYHKIIQAREEVNYHYLEEKTNEYANVRIARIMEEDKTINSLFEAMIEYCNVREKELEVIAVHYAEFTAIDQLMSKVRLLVFNKGKNSKNGTGISMEELIRNQMIGDLPKDGETPVVSDPARNHNQYDLAISFAGEDRLIAETIADKLISLGFDIFYDKYEQAKLWGKDLYEHLNEIYSKKAKFCLMIISKNYAQKHWTNHERRAAQAKAFSQNEGYILPLRLDDTEIPGINATIGYVDYTTTGLADTITLLCQKMDK